MIDPLKKQSILIVDDEPANLRVLSEFLMDCGYDVLVAQDGETALYRAEKMLPDLILLDIKMPKMDGFETCNHLKNNPLTRDIPVIFITAFIDVDNKIKGFDAGAVDYVTKPIQNREVLARVHTHLTLRQLQQELEKRNQSLVESIQSFSKLVRPDTAYDELLHLLTEQFRADRCQIISWDADAAEMQIRAVSPELNQTDFSRNVLMEAVNSGKPHLARNVLDDPAARLPNEKFLSVIVVPMCDEYDQVKGALYLDRRDPQHEPFTDADLQNVRHIASILTPILVQQESVERSRIRSEIRKLDIFVGNSRKMQQVYKEIEKAAKVDSTVYIHGESGTGKELVAKALHQLSARRQKPFIAINCAAVPRELAESEFFGYDKGAFSGAVTLKQGKFELADGGTLFLDEIADLPMELQAKLLRAIQEKEIWRVGGQKAIPVDVRIVIATSKHLEEEVKKGNFRPDLYYRFNVLQINVPPLRERKEDIPLLAEHFLDKFGSHIPGFTPEAIRALQAGDWRGNVRELENFIEKAAVYHEGDQPLTLHDLFPKGNAPQIALSEPQPELSAFSGGSLDDHLARMEKAIVQQALDQHQGHKSNTANALGITRSRLDRIMERHGLIV